MQQHSADASMEPKEEQKQGFKDITMQLRRHTKSKADATQPPPEEK